MKASFRLTILLFVLLGISACGSAQSQTSSDPAAVLEALESAWNAKDLDAAMSLFTEDAVETNGQGTFTGRDQIRGVYERFMDVFSMECGNYEVDGSEVTYECALTSYDGRVKTGERYESVVEGGKIKSNLLVGTFTP